MVGTVGLEPTATCLEGRCSIHLSYVPARIRRLFQCKPCRAFPVLVARPSRPAFFSWLLFNNEQQIVRLHTLMSSGHNLVDASRNRRIDRRLHLHGLHHQ